VRLCRFAVGPGCQFANHFLNPLFIDGMPLRSRKFSISGVFHTALNRSDGTHENYREESCRNNNRRLQEIAQLAREHIEDKEKTEQQFTSAEQPANYGSISVRLENDAGVKEKYDSEHSYLNPA